MKKIFTLILVLAGGISFAQFPSQNISLLSNWFDPAVQPEPFYGAKYSGCFGWVDTDGKEYAIIGATDGTYFVEVTNPTAPVVRDYVPGRQTGCLWREQKTYQNYCYMVSDDGGPNSFQIADLSYLPDSVHIVHDDNTIFERSHTIYVDGNKLYCGSVTTTSSFYPMAVYSLANPEIPTLLRTLDQDFPSIPGHVHDMFVRNDTVYASGGYDGFFIYKFNGSNFTLINSMTAYPGQGYNHSSFLTADGSTLVMCDEVPANLPVKTVDVSNIANSISVIDQFKSNEGATAHNPYVLGNDRAVVAYYQDGIQIFDISDPSNVTRTGYFDTHPQNGLNNGYPSPPYQGCWGAYTDLPSGNIIASDMQNGLFVLNASLSIGINDQQPQDASVSVYPNPFDNDFTVSVAVSKQQTLSYELADITGRVISMGLIEARAGISEANINTQNLAGGMYIIRIKGDGISLSQKLVKK